MHQPSLNNKIVAIHDNEKPYVKKLLYSLSYFLEVTNLDLTDVSELCERSLKREEHFLTIDYMSAQLFFEKINISEKMFFDQSYCVNTLIKQLNGDTLVIPEESIGNRGSKVKTIKNAISGLSSLSQKKFYQDHQIHCDYLENENNAVSIKVFANALNCTRESMRITPFHVGYNNGNGYCEDFKRLINRESSVQKSVSTLIKHSQVVEKNMAYSILESDSKLIVIESKPKPETEEILRDMNIHHDIFSNNIAGFLSGFVQGSKGVYVQTNIKLSSRQANIIEVIAN